VKIFDRLGVGSDTYVTQAAGGDFTSRSTHEFQTLCESGEDTIYIDEQKHLAYNKEVVSKEDINKLKKGQACEVGNIFPLGTKYSRAFGYTYADQQGKQRPVIMASYGIGSSRVMGLLAEKFNDEKGIIWPEAVAPFQVHGIVLNMDKSETGARGAMILKQLEEKGIEVLWDDRPEVSAGEKLADADLIGCPWRLVVSSKTGSEVEVKRRDNNEATLMSVKAFIDTVAQ
jgi:prolyl-tRNA synthetase